MNKQVLNEKNRSFVFMKVGDHAGETFEDILARKRKEYVKTGMIFWGYGGNACHPIQQIRPFARSVFDKQGSLYLLMQPIHSNADPDILPATEFSADGVTWEKIPKGIEVTGSRYALVLDEILPEEIDINLEQYVIGIGPSIDRRAQDYLKGRTDKACLVHSPTHEEILNKNNIRGVKYAARMQEPFAVLLRH